MASVKELRVRIKSVGGIKQITRAMEMVATTKLRRFQDRAVASRPFADEIAGLVQRLAGLLGEEVAERPLFQKGPGSETLVLVISSDRGLCGPYNSNLFRALEEWRRAHLDRQVRYYVYGKKAYQYMSTRGFDIEQVLTEPKLEAIDFHNAAITSRMLQSEFESGRFDEVWVLSTRFESMSRFVPTFAQFLPVQAEAVSAQGASQAQQDVILEPDAGTIFDQLVPRYLETRIYNALIESLTSEYASRRFAMKNATDAATDMQKALRGVYNRKRQENITKELLDIVGGAEAVK